jgi:hypothetical protein
MSVSSGEKPSSERPVEIGPPGGDGARAPLPSLARTEEERGRTSGSGLPGAAAPSYSLVQRGRSDVAQDPRAVRAVLTTASGKSPELRPTSNFSPRHALEFAGRRFCSAKTRKLARGAGPYVTLPADEPRAVAPCEWPRSARLTRGPAEPPGAGDGPDSRRTSIRPIETSGTWCGPAPSHLPAPLFARRIGRSVRTGSNARLPACKRDQDSGCPGPRQRLARIQAEAEYGRTFLFAGSGPRLRTGHPAVPRHSATRSPWPLACGRHFTPGVAWTWGLFRCLTAQRAWVPSRLPPGRIRSWARTGCTWCSARGRSGMRSRPCSRYEA